MQQKISQLCANRVPRTTDNNNRWALSVYEDFAVNDLNVPTFFQEIPINRLNYVLARLIAVKGDSYRPRTFYQILTALNR